MSSSSNQYQNLYQNFLNTAQTGGYPTDLNHQFNANSMVGASGSSQDYFLNNYYVAAVAAATQNSYANGQSGSAY
jgi:hypothetical protein